MAAVLTFSFLLLCVIFSSKSSSFKNISRYCQQDSSVFNLQLCKRAIKQNNINKFFGRGTSLLLALMSLTILIEVVIGYIMGIIWRVNNMRKLLIAVALSTVISYPFFFQSFNSASIFLQVHHPHANPLIFVTIPLEIIVAIFEGIILYILVGTNIGTRKALLLSVIMNFASAFLGYKLLY